MSEPTLALALAAGLASFLSPCMLPVIPAFLAQLAGTSLDFSDLKRRDVLLGTVLFVAGFSAVFALLGVGWARYCRVRRRRCSRGSHASPARSSSSWGCT